MLGLLQNVAQSLHRRQHQRDPGTERLEVLLLKMPRVLVPPVLGRFAPLFAQIPSGSCQPIAPGVEIADSHRLIRE
jgi:hypothetical protein